MACILCQLHFPRQSALSVLHLNILGCLPQRGTKCSRHSEKYYFLCVAAGEVGTAKTNNRFDSGSVPVPGNSSSTQIVKAGGFEDVPMMRKTVDSAPQHLVTIYQSPNSCCQKIGHQDAKKLNIRKPKLTHVRENASADGQMSNTSKHRFIYLTKH